jgi:uncharacterized protein (DUF58 family)
VQLLKGLAGSSIGWMSTSVASARQAQSTSFSPKHSLMAAVVFDSRSKQGRVASILTTDFCPWANRYFYWLKEPIGWFVLAFAASVLVGMHLSTVGWVLATVIGSVILTGIVWPWVVVRAAQCRLRPAVTEIYEDQACDLVLSVRNRWPLPLWGLAIEGYLDRHGDDARPTIALACVPMISDAEYRLRVSPQLRGQYPVVTPHVACSMPFGIWTARRSLKSCSPLTVFPKISHIQDEPQLRGGRTAETGDGLRAGQAGEPLGVREFRSGDRLRNVHWIHTARTGMLTVCERGGPQQQQIEIVLDAHVPQTVDPDRQLAIRESLARRVRVAASLAIALHSRNVPVRLVIGRSTTVAVSGTSGRRSILTALAAVPADGLLADEQASSLKSAPGRMVLRVCGDAADFTAVQVFIDPGGRSRGRGAEDKLGQQVMQIASDISLDHQLVRFWHKAGQDYVAA